jgi:predicted TIM-barrel fold metal-dependent hydrolase
MSAEANPQDLLAPYRIIDCDAHWSEPPDLWTSRAPASLKDRVPYVKREGGRDRWFIEGDQEFGSVGLCIVDKSGVKHLGLGGSTLSDGDVPGTGYFDDDEMGNFVDPTMPTFDMVPEAAYDAQARVKLLDELGIWAQVVYPNSAGVSTTKFMNMVPDDDLRLACITLYNDACADWQRESGDRLLPQALLPVWDQGAMEAEARRAIEDLGLRGFVISDKPESMGLPDFTRDYWAGLWDFASSTSTAINFHIGGNPDTSPIMKWPWESFGPEGTMAITAPLFAMGTARTLLCFALSGLLDKYPGLKLVSVESGVGWLPYMIEAMEYQLDEMMPNEGRHLQRRPREYFRDHFFGTFWFEVESFKKAVEVIGPNNFLLETDYPHPTCLYPPADHIARVVKDLSEHERARILQDNAAELYRVKLPQGADA